MAGTKFDLDTNGILTIGSQSGARAYLSSDFSFKGGIRIPFDSVTYNPHSEFDTTKYTGSATSTEAGYLNDNVNTPFSSADEGRFVYNTTDDTYTTIKTFVSSSKVELNDDIMANGENYTVYSGRFKPTTAGYYLVNLNVYMDNPPSTCEARIKKTGTTYGSARHGYNAYDDPECLNISNVLYLATSDYIEGYVDGGYTTPKDLSSGEGVTTISIHKLS